MDDLMIDLETLDTKPSAIILAIGAVKFDLVTGRISDEGFYRTITIDSNQEVGRTMSGDTVEWWMKQSDAARALFADPDKASLRHALEDFIAWVGPNSNVRPWGNGPTFDLVKVSSACDQVGLSAPWVYWNERCVRTYRALPGAKTVPKIVPAIAHHALHDAHAQAEHVCNIYRAIFVDGVKRSSMVKG